MKYIIYTDGGSRGNPGPAAIGVVIANEKGETIKSYGEAIGPATNNEAEYQAVILALKKIKALYGKDKIKEMEIEVRMDSELVMKQLNHQYKISESHIQLLFIRVWNTLIDFGPVKFIHIPREQNTEADRLVNQALDKEQGELF
ncbi:MAG: Ribonuclease H [Parcubacteria group bacterium GW2011_GWC2_42_6]|nr:MAG: Ribonuclease H [Parcubacteria group bacterium GW2011_GWA2_42_11]KKS68439.1 MAG: Ribonuclease H [Parcubacteria group bacterium GW2011_GWC2_42_6]KKT76528.1 MAG: Ribonuclease H [Parcubacteria group bacterium GW2011_GWF2_44_7]